MRALVAVSLLPGLLGEKPGFLAASKSAAKPDLLAASPGNSTKSITSLDPGSDGNITDPGIGNANQTSANVTAPTSPPCVAAFGQCGGQDYKGLTCCVSPYVCMEKDKYWSMCAPASFANTTITTTAPFLMGPDGCNGPWMQCGGLTQAGTPFTASGCCLAGLVCTQVDETYKQCQYVTSKTMPAEYEPVAELKTASDSLTYTFFMYRAVSLSGARYPSRNVNTGTLSGILWYLHNEVVWKTPRKFEVSLIKRLKVSMKATQPLLNKGMKFGVRYAFDRGQCTGPYSCDKAFNEFGYFVGCNKLGDFPFPTYPVYYPGAIWYSLPGACPSKRYMEENASCDEAEPGGFCKGPVTGAGDCTYTYEEAGNISLDELEGIKDYNSFALHGGVEYNKSSDQGVGTSFWDGINSMTKNEARLAKARALFAKKYPDMPTDDDLPAPDCDFDYEKFYGTPLTNRSGGATGWKPWE